MRQDVANGTFQNKDWIEGARCKPATVAQQRFAEAKSSMHTTIEEHEAKRKRRRTGEKEGE